MARAKAMVCGQCPDLQEGAGVSRAFPTTYGHPLARDPATAMERGHFLAQLSCRWAWLQGDPCGGGGTLDS